MSVPEATYRPIQDEDLEFLYEVFCTSRPDVDHIEWADGQKEQFLRMQFQAQHSHYQNYYPDAQFDVLLLDGQPAGRRYVFRDKEVINLMDLTVLPEHRNQGVGTRIIQELLDEGARTDRPVRVWVEHYNPSLTLFQRLGFQHIGDEQINLHLEWQPPGVTN